MDVQLTFDNIRQSHKSCGVCTWEIVDTLSTDRRTQTRERSAQEFHMRRFLSCNLLQFAVKGIWKAGIDEFPLAVVLKSLTVEGILNVLKGESVV